MHCLICNKPEQEAELHDGIYESRIGKICIQCAEDENIPLLRKDFIIHPFQIYESYNMGADIILLIAACLSFDELSEMYLFARELGMQVLVEVHSEEELEMVLKIKKIVNQEIL